MPQPNEDKVLSNDPICDMANDAFGPYLENNDNGRRQRCVSISKPNDARWYNRAFGVNEGWRTKFCMKGMINIQNFPSWSSCITSNVYAEWVTKQCQWYWSCYQIPFSMLKFHVHSMKPSKSLLSLAFITPKLMLSHMIACYTFGKTKTKTFVRNEIHPDGS